MSRRCTRWLEGRGLHGGAPTRARVVIERERGPVAFRRVDLPGAPTLAAVVAHARAGEGAYSTSLYDASGLPFAGTIEHVLSAIVGAGAQGAVVELEGDELPCLDGAAALWLDALDEAGLTGGSPPVSAVTVETSLTFERGGSRLSLRPAAHPSVEVEVRFPLPIGVQRASWDGTTSGYRAGLAGARTFALAPSAVELLERGLARGVALDAAVVFTPEGPMVPLRWPDEPARHKLLDLVGDLALLGGLPRATVHATRPGHAFVVAALRALFPAP